MGRLIAIDGLDGSGKETQSERLENYLTSKGEKVRRLSFPTYDDIGSALVSFYLKGGFGENANDTGPYAASTFFAADRYYSYNTDWKKDYESDKTVIVNRYTTANAVHQLSKLDPSEWDGFLSWLWDFEFTKLKLPVPDKVFYLEMRPEHSMRLIKARAEQTGRFVDIHEKDPTHLERSYAAAMYASEKLGWNRIRCYDGDRIKTREEISAEIFALI